MNPSDPDEPACIGCGEALTAHTAVPWHVSVHPHEHEHQCLPCTLRECDEAIDDARASMAAAKAERLAAQLVMERADETVAAAWGAIDRARSVASLARREVGRYAQDARDAQEAAEDVAREASDAADRWPR